jgi:hypothetical protein
VSRLPGGQKEGSDADQVADGVSVDGFVADVDGVPAIALADGFVPGESHGFPEFIAGCDAPGS